MGIFSKRQVKEIDKPIEERTIPEIIESVLHVNPMNKDGIIKSWHQHNSSLKFPKRAKGLLSEGDSYWMNPNQQSFFDHGHLTHQDFVDWANGTGRVVRGKTQEHKDKFMRAALADLKYDSYALIYLEHLWMLDEESKTKWAPSYRNRAYKNPINLSNRRESSVVIKEMFSEMVQPLLRDIKDAWDWHGRHNPEENHSDWLRNLTQRHREYMHGVCHVLAVGGHGYFDACNTPCELENLSWSKDLPFAKAYSLFLEEIDPGIIECFQWCRKNRYERFENGDEEA